MAKKTVWIESLPAAPPPDFKVGDTVTYIRYFLKCIFVYATDPLWDARGKVIRMCEAKGYETWPYVLWENDPTPKMVNPNNIAHVGGSRFSV